VGSVVGTAFQEPDAAWRPSPEAWTWTGAEADAGDAAAATGDALAGVAGVGGPGGLGEGGAALPTAGEVGGEGHLTTGGDEEPAHEQGRQDHDPDRGGAEQDHDGGDEQQADQTHEDSAAALRGLRGRGEPTGVAGDDDLARAGRGRTPGHHHLARPGAHRTRVAAAQGAHRLGEAVGGLGGLLLVVTTQPHGDENEGPHADDGGVDEGCSSHDDEATATQREHPATRA
jgi:hypothetical protein